MNRPDTVIPRSFLAITAGVATLCALAAMAQPVAQDGLLRDGSGRTLYTFDRDAAGESRCFGACAAAWPPYMAAEGAAAQGRLTVVARAGGGMQWAFDGRPLYLFAGDAKPGDAAGDGSGGVWHVVRPATPGEARAQAVQPQGDPYKY